MLRERIEQLQQEYTDQYVIVEGGPPEMAQLRNRVGRVKTINMNGRALIQFEGADKSRHDVELDYVKVVDKPEPEPEKAASKPTTKGAEKHAAKNALAGIDSFTGLSRLEIARAEEDARQKTENEAEDATEENRRKN